MQIICLLIFIQVFAATLYAQQQVWRKNIIDNNLTIALPGKATETDTILVVDKRKETYRLFRITTETTNFAITVTEELGITTSESFERNFTEFDEGIKKTATGRSLEYNSSDTIIGGMRCKKAILFSKDSANNTKIYLWLFIANNNAYNIAAFPLEGDTDQSKSDINKMINSIHFTEAAKKELPSKEYQIGYRFGQLLFFAILLGVIGLIIYFVARPKRN